MQQFSDAEVQQVCLAVFGDEHVGRLEVAVHDQSSVRVGHRASHLLEQAQALGYAQAVVVAIAVDGLAGNVFERKVRPATRVDAGVVEAGDVRVLQQGADIALALHTFCQTRAPGQPRQLQRHLALQRAVFALGQPHSTHASTADFADQSIGADLVARGRELFAACRFVAELGQRGQEVAATGAGLTRLFGQHLAQHRRQRLVGRRQCCQPAFAFAQRQIHRLVQQTTQRSEFGGGDGHASGGFSASCQPDVLPSGNRTSALTK